MGENGSYILADGQIIEIPSYKVPVIDTTGAGEAYATGFIHYYLEGLDLKDIGTRAAACAALQITLSNARDGMLKKDEVEEFIKSKQTM
ncbi:MAG: carbohydrate kinase family protein [Candidatus Heimdallarchaeota archaeon]